MCGIAGQIVHQTDPQTISRARESVTGMVETLAHRGPDQNGLHIIGDAVFGHARLSIVDLSENGRQPMTNEDGSVMVSYNGEIYNAPALREELIDDHQFRSRSDTEVLVHGYEAWGFAGLLERLEGMFAFALWDENIGHCFLARDVFGIKPLYYRHDGNCLAFASEVKALLALDDEPPQPDLAAILPSLQHIGVPAPATMYQGIAQLPPATWMRLETKTGRVTTQRYWHWPLAPDDELTESAAVSLVWEGLCKSVEKHLLADVDVGIFLSGGFDSSLIAAACAEVGRKPTCLTIAINDPNYDESAAAASLCRHYGLPHWVEKMDIDTGRDFDSNLTDCFDEPFASSAALSAAYISRLAATRFKVMLSGEGGDELFGGYKWYHQWLTHYGQSGDQGAWWQAPHNTLRRWAGRRALPKATMAGYAALMGAFPEAELSDLFSATFLADFPADAVGDYEAIDDPGLVGFDRLQSLDLQLFLPVVCLRKMDRCSMRYGLEVRVPMLDRTMAALAGRVPAALRNPDGALKGLLKQLSRHKLPADLVAKKKQGFSTPISRWFPAADIVKQLATDMEAGDWWRPVFAPTAVDSAARMRGRRLWRFWHTWRWVKAVSTRSDGS